MAAITLLAPSTASSQTFDVIHRFDAPPINPFGTVIEGSDGALYGTAYKGGPYDAGKVFKIEKDGSGFTTLHDFDGIDGIRPRAPLMEASDGMLYGMSESSAFRISKDGTGFLKLHTFTDGNNGVNGPEGFAGFIEGSDGVLYATRPFGGLFGYGTVFKLKKDGTGLLVLHDFKLDLIDGVVPIAGVIEATDGALYGTTISGGINNDGIAFKINKDGSGFLKLHDFYHLYVGNAAYAKGGVIEGADGALYGCAGQGGYAGTGAVFTLNKDGTGYSHIHDFGLARNCSGVVEGSDQLLYGTTPDDFFDGPGSVFKLEKDGSGYQEVYHFSLGEEPAYSIPVEGSDGMLYSTSLTGGSNGAGTVFKINKDGTGFLSLYDFTYGGGAHSSASLFKGSDDIFYGTTRTGGAAGSGTVFKVNQDGTGYSIVYSFHSRNAPNAAPIEGSDGALYGMSNGLVFKVNKDGTDFRTLHEFSYDQEDPSYGALIEGSDGLLYGTNSRDVNFGYGLVFRIHKNGTDFETLHAFDYTDGGYPLAGVVEGPGGILYGTTSLGGAFGGGTVFKLNKSGTGFANLHDFNGREGSAPYAGLLEGSDGALFGTTFFGGTKGDGVIFKLNKDGTGFAILHAFGGQSEGTNPDGGLIEGPNGVLYGTTTAGGANGYGTAFRLNKDGSGFRTLHAFDYADGASPSAELVQGSDGAFYGSALNGGSGGGTLFRLAVSCEASIDVTDDVRAPGSMLGLHVHIEHHRPVTVTVPWEISLIDPLGRVVKSRTIPPHTFEPGDIVDKALVLQLPKDLGVGTYTVKLAIDGMHGTQGSTTTFRVIRAE